MTTEIGALTPAKGERGEAVTPATIDAQNTTPRGSAEVPQLLSRRTKKMPVSYRREGTWLAEAEALIRAHLPPMTKFRSWTRAVSPVGKLMAWVDVQADREVFPNDVLVNVADMARLREEQRRWLRRVYSLRGKRLESTLDFTDIGGAPIKGRWVVKPGEVLIRRKAGVR